MSNGLILQKRRHSNRCLRKGWNSLLCFTLFSHCSAVRHRQTPGKANNLHCHWYNGRKRELHRFKKKMDRKTISGCSWAMKAVVQSFASRVKKCPFPQGCCTNEMALVHPSPLAGVAWAEFQVIDKNHTF